MTSLDTQLADATRLLAFAAGQLGVADVVAFHPHGFHDGLLRAAVRGPVVGIGGVMVRAWDRGDRPTNLGLMFGGRTYTAGGIRFLRVQVSPNPIFRSPLDGAFVVGRADYPALYRLAVAAQRAGEPPAEAPVLTPATLDSLRRNTIDYLSPANLDRIRAYGGRPRRGVLLSGPPGNGKTSACRWLRRLCRDRGLEERVVTPDDYRAARGGHNPAEQVRELFTVEKAGVVFFDDFDAALADRADREYAEDQAIFLAALDGMEVNSGVTHVFTTNLPLTRIDPAFRRPGRLDVCLPFPAPDARLRAELVGRWHPELLAAIDPAAAVAETAGMSFAEVDEFRNLLVLRFTETGVWDWTWAKEQFRVGRGELAGLK